MNSATPPSNAPDYSSKGLLTEQLVAALDQDPTMELDDLFNLSSTPPPDTGINPSLVNSREASQALESSQSTLVPAPIERQGVLNSQASLISLEQLLIPVPQKNYNPQNQVPATDPMKEEIKTMVNIIDGQWTLFLKVRNLNNTSLMKTTLAQAHSSQLLLQRAVGYEEMIKLSYNWDSKEDLDKLEKAIATKSAFVPMILDTDLTTSSHQKFKEDITYLKKVPGGSKMPDAFLPPPPPPPLQQQQNQLPSKDLLTTTPHQGSSPQFVQGQDNRSPLTTLPENANHIPPHHLGYPPTYDHQYQQGQTHTYQSSQYPQYSDNPQTYSEYRGHNHNHLYQRKNQYRWRGHGSNWRRPQDATSSMLEIGNFFIQAERAMNAMQRRGRGGRGRGNQHHRFMRGNMQGNHYKPPNPNNQQ
ncbi:hypothetical protein PCANC_24120 [Puccinia coronata f. sp. avenae]|uniref:Uncharacterized protein n=1 Tax=Puccinia coronata f. sp. avenae TaxID=200324 RepID=A0A2N5SQV3_9BASI|nr:hypothetical protein PCANC_24120 [Puccinia coronata f. sp. avenae]